MWGIYEKEKEMSEPPYGVQKAEILYFADKDGNNPVELKGLTFDEEIFSLTKQAEIMRDAIEESERAFVEMGEALRQTFTYNLELERGAAKLLWAIFGPNKKYLKEEALHRHYRKKMLRDATREDPERSKMHAAYGRRQKSRSRRKRH